MKTKEEKNGINKRYDNILIDESGPMKKVHSCGVFLFNDKNQFLVLQKSNNSYDIPKGHLEKGETLIETAKRELQEETGIDSDYELHPDFICQSVYYPKYKRLNIIIFFFNFFDFYYRFGGETVEKKFTIFLGKLLKEKKIELTEHSGYQWIDYKENNISPNERLKFLFEKLEDFEKTKQLTAFLNK